MLKVRYSNTYVPPTALHYSCSVTSKDMLYSYLLFQHRHPKQTGNNGQICIPSCNNNQTKWDIFSVIDHMFSGMQKKEVPSIYTYWHISVFITSHHMFLLWTATSVVQSVDLLGARSGSNHGSARHPQQSAEKLMRAFWDAQFPNHGAIMKKAISDVMRRCNLRSAHRCKHEDLNYSLVISNTFCNKYPCNKLSYATKWTFLVSVIQQTMLNITIQDTNHLILLCILLLLWFLKFSALLTFLLFLFNSSF